MRTFRLAKLVRDGIPQSYREGGGKVANKQLKGQQLIEALIAKIQEEAAELDPSELSTSELGDIKEAFDELCNVAGVGVEELKAVQDKKRARIGGFKEGLYIDTVTLPDDSKWTEYHAADPTRFPEIK